MEDNGLFVIDLSGCTNTGEIINNVSLALEIPNASGKGICLKLKDNVLNQSQILSIKSLIESYNSRLAHVETGSLITQNACESMGIKVIQTQVHQIVSENASVDNFEAPQAEDSIKNINDKPELKLEVPELQAEPIQSESINFIEQPIKIESAVEEKKSVIEPAPHIIRNEEFQKLKEEIEKENNQGTADEPAESKETPLETIVEPMAETFNGAKQVIGVYKKASDETQEDFEEVDFYAPPTDEPVVIDSKQTIYVNQTLRSGQTLEFDGNIVIIGDCHPGSEIKATGDITIWGVLGSIAHAGAKGNRDAKIRALKMNAVQLRIANCYSRRPDTTNIPYIVKSSVFTPEEARIVDDGIVLFKLG